MEDAVKKQNKVEKKEEVEEIVEVEEVEVRGRFALNMMGECT